MQQDYNKYNFNQDRSDYLTPPELLGVIFQELNLLGLYCGDMFQCDVCCTEKNIPAVHYFIDGEKDGLIESWHKLNYCNPPYKDCDKWVRKAYEEMQAGKTTVMLIPARPETKYWQECFLNEGYANKKGVHIKFLRKGYCFLHPETKEQMGVYKNPLVIVILDGRQFDKAVA